MSLLSYLELRDLIDSGVIENSNYDAINSASIDLTLGSIILVEEAVLHNDFKRLNKKASLNVRRVELGPETEYTLHPGEFILAQTVEVFNLPNNISAEYKLKSSMARLGLDHLNAGWADSGWFGSVLTLELKNVTRNHTIVLRAGDKIGQMVFFRHTAVPDDKSYAVRGSYNGDKETTGVKVKGDVK
jgi:dCTP deaminase